MKTTFAFLLLLLLATPVSLQAQGVNPGSEDRLKLAALFAKAADHGGTVTIPPGDYYLDGAEPIPLASRTTVFAYGARFHLPEKLGDQARAVVFAGENVSDFRWFGGHFIGRVFDPDRTDNFWEPNANTRGILITTTSGGETTNLTFRDVSSDGMAGAVITVLGAAKPGSDREIDTYARNVTVENCTLQRSGKFMWDYGYLWQITVWPEDYNDAERALAAKYFPSEYIRGSVRMKQGDDRVYLDNAKTLPVSERDYRGQQSLCFYNDDLPLNIVRGRQYFIVESDSEFIRIADKPGGTPIRFASDSGSDSKLMYPLFHAHLALYAPKGSGPGKGALDLVGCEAVIVRGCRLSALGDTMHLQKSQDIVFSGNHITGSRMGAFFLAEFCRNAVVTGNTVDGTNGSRVISVEKSCEDVTIVGNTFRNGGRGSWINQAEKLCAGGQRLRQQHDQVRTPSASWTTQLRHWRLRGVCGTLFHDSRTGRSLRQHHGARQHLHQRRPRVAHHHLRPRRRHAVPDRQHLSRQGPHDRTNQRLHERDNPRKHHRVTAGPFKVTSNT